MSEQNSTFILQDSCLVKDETDKCLDHNSILLDFIKEEIKTYQNNDNNQSYHIEENIINKFNSITLESSNVDAINVFDIKTENDDSNNGIQNSLLIIEDNLVKQEIDIKEEILTYPNDDDNNETNHIENVAAYNNRTNSITIDTLNACIDVKTEKDCKNSIFVIKDENNSFANTHSSLLCSNSEENTTFQNNYDNYPSYHNKNVFTKIEPICDINAENNFEVKTEIDYKTNNFETSMNVVKSDHKGVNKHNIVQFKSITNSDKRRYKCDICKQSFIHKKDLKNHIFIHIAEKQHKCNICQKSFAENGYLKNHMFTHTGEKPYTCDICQKSFIQKRNLNNHLFTHTGENPYKCDMCQKSFIQKVHLNNHIITHTNEKPHKCDICYKSFTGKDHFKNHMFIHTGEKPYKCDICQKSFIRQTHLKSHIFTHSGKKPYKCDICQKSLTRQTHLKSHMLTHTSIKPYKCNICEKSFKQKLHLKRHIFTHAGEKRYKCSICLKSFPFKHTFNNHILIHTGEKPYKCDICQKSFIQKIHLKKHRCNIYQTSFL